MLIDASRLPTDILKSYDDMMMEAVISVKRFAPLAVNIWTEVLRELDVRGLVTLASGSYDKVGDALIQRHWKAED